MAPPPNFSSIVMVESGLHGGRSDTHSWQLGFHSKLFARNIFRRFHFYAYYNYQAFTLFRFNPAKCLERSELCIDYFCDKLPHWRKTVSSLICKCRWIKKHGLETEEAMGGHLKPMVRAHFHISSILLPCAIFILILLTLCYYFISPAYMKESLESLLPWLAKSNTYLGSFTPGELRDCIRSEFRQPSSPPSSSADLMDRAFTSLRVLGEQLHMAECSSTAITDGVRIDVCTAFVGVRKL